MVDVRLGKPVKYKDLETALLKATKEIGLKTKVKHIYKREYILGSVREEQIYSQTNITLSGNIFPSMTIFGINRRISNDTILITTGLPFGIASERKVRQYIEAVSKYI